MELELVDGGYAVDIEINTSPPVAGVALAVVRGEVGPTGATGPVGPQGVAGQVGSAGPAGATGPQGIQGIQGVAGAIGATGPQGAVGAVGAQGIQGVPGERGEKGDKGDTGQQGVAGVSLDIQGSVATYADLPGNAVAGDAWIVLADGKLYYRDATGFPANGSGVPFQGPQGIAGVAGERGDQGIQGIQGIQGERGEVGPAGAVGATGATGSQGVAGVQGVAGADGQGFVWRGAFSSDLTYAAYDVVSFEGSSYVALSGGATGSPVGAPASWAALALKGATGATGPAGADSTVPGPTGATGPAGPTGATGPAGPTGPAGSGGGGGSLWECTDLGFKGWNFDPQIGTDATQVQSTQWYLSAVKVPQDCTVSNIYFWVTGVGSGVVEFRAGIYSTDPADTVEYSSATNINRNFDPVALLGSSNSVTTFSTSLPTAFPLTEPVSLTAGVYQIAWYCNATTRPTMLRAYSHNNLSMGRGKTAYWSGWSPTEPIVFPTTTAAFGSMTNQSQWYWVAVS